MPRIVDHDERRREIADAMLEIVAELGIGAATIRAVADKSGWSTGVITHYFKSRDDLLMGGLRRAGERSAMRQREIGRTMIGRQAVEAILEENLPLDKRRLALTRIFVFFYAAAAADPVMRVEIDGYLSLWRRQTEKAIGAAQKSGDIDAALDPGETAADLVAMADGLSCHALYNEEIRMRLAGSSPIRLWVSRLAPGASRAAHRDHPVPVNTGE